MEDKKINVDNIEEAKEVSDALVKQETELPKKPEAVSVPEDVKKWLTTQDYYLLAPKHQLNTLLAQLQDAKNDRETLVNIAIEIMILFGYVDPNTRKVKPEIATGEESWMPGMLKSLADVMGTLTKSKFAVTKKQKAECEAELAKKFAFVSNLMPILTKYGA
jgi:hypothetical protein